ncbi:MAG: hypothetical protein RSF87_07375 [Cellulosilyticaceae bacterium]
MYMSEIAAITGVFVNMIGSTVLMVIVVGGIMHLVRLQSQKRK